MSIFAQAQNTQQILDRKSRYIFRKTFIRAIFPSSFSYKHTQFSFFFHYFLLDASKWVESRRRGSVTRCDRSACDFTRASPFADLQLVFMSATGRIGTTIFWLISVSSLAIISSFFKWSTTKNTTEPKKKVNVKFSLMSRVCCLKAWNKMELTSSERISIVC